MTYYFCCASCLRKFHTNPTSYLEKKGPQANIETPPGTQFTCPMHPDVVSPKQMPCPKCGMALDPIGPTTDQGPTPEEGDFRWRFWCGACLTVPVFLLAMGPMIVGQRLAHHLSHPFYLWTQGILSSMVVFLCGWPILDRGWASIRTRNPNMFTLIGMGVGAAYSYSLAALFFPDRFPSGFHGSHSAVEPYFETAAVVTVLVLLGQLLEARARRRASQAIAKLMTLAPQSAHRLEEDGKESDIPVDQLKVHERVRIKPGERVPIDGLVLEGSSGIDESMITGEPIPVEKTKNSWVLAGTVNGTGSLVVRMERQSDVTVLARIIQSVTHAQRSRAPIQRLADQTASYLVPFVLLCAIVTFMAWSFFGKEAPLAMGFLCSVSVLVIACPCALGLATPLAIIVGAGKGAENGVLFRDMEALETLYKANVLVLDKTGTLTEGKPVVQNIHASGLLPDDDCVRFAASLEQASEHPLARAMVTYAESKQIKLFPVESFQATPGQGVLGTVAGSAVVVGTPRFLGSLGIAVLEEVDSVGGRTVLCLAVDGEWKCNISLGDSIRMSSPKAIDQLRAEGLELRLLTGDNQQAAAAVASALGIIHVRASVLPEEKASHIRELQSAGKIVAMAGDGINDAPALAQANIGIALGSGTDIAMETAGVTLIRPDLQAIVRARLLSRFTVRAIWQNLALAFGYNLLSIPVAAGMLYPIFGVLINPMWASLAMALSSLSLVGNALRLNRIKLVN